MISCVVSGWGRFLTLGAARALPALVLGAGACAQISGASDLHITGGGAEAGAGGSSAAGGSSGGSGGTAGLGGSSGSAGSTQVDYRNGSWQLENVSNSPNRYSREPTLLRTDAGFFVAWTEPDGANQAQVWAGPIGQPATMITTAGATTPSLAFSQGQVLLSWVSSEDGDYDVYLGKGPSFSERFNLTVDDPTDVGGKLAVGGGTNAVAHRSWIGEAFVFVRTWTDPASTDPTQVISGKGLCEDLNLEADAAGKLHLLTICPSGVDGGNVFYTNNVLGSWLPPADIGAATVGNRNGALAMGPNDTWFAAWTSGLKDLVFASQSSEGTWSQPKVALPDINRAAIAVDPQGRQLVAFDRPDGNVYFTWFENGLFTTPVHVGAGEAPRALVLDAAGLPHFVFELESVPGQTASTDIWLAKFVPAG